MLMVKHSVQHSHISSRARTHWHRGTSWGTIVVLLGGAGGFPPAGSFSFRGTVFGGGHNSAWGTIGGHISAHTNVPGGTLCRLKTKKVKTEKQAPGGAWGHMWGACAPTTMVPP